MGGAMDDFLSLRSRRGAPSAAAPPVKPPRTDDVERTAPAGDGGAGPTFAVVLCMLWAAHWAELLGTWRAGCCAGAVVWALFVANHHPHASAQEAKTRFALGLLPLLAWSAWWRYGRGLGGAAGAASLAAATLGALGLLLWLGKETPGFGPGDRQRAHGRIA